MPKGKNFKKATAMVDREKLYSLEEAVSLLKKMSYAKFDQTIDLGIGKVA